MSHCPGQNAEVETATSAPHNVYDLWIGCGGIGFARSTGGGLHFGRSMTAPGSAGFSWDPAITVSPAGVVYLSFMHRAHRQMYPVVDASFDHGVSFPQVSAKFGNRQIWPGDTFGIAHVPGGTGTRLALSWGSAILQHTNSQIYAAVVSPPAATAPAACAGAASQWSR